MKLPSLKPLGSGLFSLMIIMLLTQACRGQAVSSLSSALEERLTQGITFEDNFFCADYPSLIADKGLPPNLPITPQSKTPDNLQITPGQSLGDLPLSTSHLDLVKRVGEENVHIGPVYLGEGQCELGSILYPHDKRYRVELHWEDKTHLTGLTTARILDERSAWTLPQGIKVGTPAETIEMLNGLPVLISGFGWDYGGYLTGWQGGRLEKLLPGVTLRFAPMTEWDQIPKKQRELSDSVLGDASFASNHKGIRLWKPEVGEILISPPADKAP